MLVQRRTLFGISQRVHNKTLENKQVPQIVEVGQLQILEYTPED